MNVGWLRGEEGDGVEDFGGEQGEEFGVAVEDEGLVGRADQLCGDIAGSGVEADGPGDGMWPGGWYGRWGNFGQYGFGHGCGCGD